MKKLLLIIVLLVITLTKLMAQKNETIEIKKNQIDEFKIFAKVEADINLKFDLQKDDAFHLLILNKKENIVFSKKYNKEGINKIPFVIEEKEIYTVKLISMNQQNLVVTTVAKKN